MGFKGQLLLALALNIGLKVFTFALSTFLTRLLSPEQSGISFSYAVYVDSALFIAREAVRNTASRLGVYNADTASREGEGSARCVSARAARRLAHLGFLAVPIACATLFVFEVAQGVLPISLLPSLRHTAASASFASDNLSSASGHAAVGGARSMGLLSVLDSTARGCLPSWLSPFLPEVLVALSILLSASAEPCLVVAQSLDLYRVVVLAEFVSLLSRLLVTIALVRRTSSSSSVMSTPYGARLVFAVGQMTYAVSHAGYCMLVCSRALGGHGRAAAAIRRFLGGSEELGAVCRAAEASDEPQGGGQARPLTARLVAFPLSVLSPRGTYRTALSQLALLRSFFAESVLRLVLTEGEGFAIASVGTEAARGHYQLVSNLGSLVARLVFRLWENACFVRWSRDAATGAYAAATALLVLMLRVSFYFGFAFVLLGPPFSATLLQTLYSRRWSTTGTVRALQVYCYAVPCMAWNGLLEAFLRAVASPQALQRQQRVMLVQSLLYVVLCYVGLTIVVVGSADDGAAVCFLIRANIVSMLARIAYTLWVLTRPPTQSLGSSGKEGGPAAPLLTLSALRAATPLNNGVLALALAAMLVATRSVTASLAKLLVFTAGYVCVVLGLDSDVRAMALRLAAPALQRLRMVGGGGSGGGDDGTRRPPPPKEKRA